MDALPTDVIRIIASKLGVDGLWRDMNDVVADCCSLAMASKCMRELSVVLADSITKETGLPRPTKKQLAPIELTVTMSSSLDELKTEAKRLRLRSGGRKLEIYERLVEARRVRDIELTVDIPKNPIPVASRWKYGATRRVTASVAKCDYRLNDDDLSELPVKLMRNPYGRNQPFMRLYDVSMVREVSLEKYGGRDGFEQAVRQSEYRKAQIRETKETKAMARKAALEEALHLVGCELRNDSRICDAYIYRGIGHPHDIAKTMLEMKFLFDHTRYKYILRDNIASLREWGEPYDIDEESQIAKIQAVGEFRRSGGNVALIPQHVR
jgi:hypothetical protein